MVWRAQRGLRLTGQTREPRRRGKRQTQRFGSGAPLQRRLVHGLRIGFGHFGVRAVGDRQNDKRVTAAVTRYGYRRGVFFEGCETRCGKGNQDPLVVGFGRPSMGAEPGNVTNLVRLRGATNSRPLHGGTRWSGEKPQGRNASAVWQQLAEWRRQRRQGVDVQRRCRRRGIHTENEFQERRIDASRSGATAGALKAAPSP